MVGVSFLSSDFDSSRVVGPTTLCRRFDYSMMKRFGRHRLLGRKCLAKFRSHWPPLKISAAAAEPGLVVAAQKFPVQQRSPKFGSVQIAMFHCFFRVGSPSDCFLKKQQQQQQQQQQNKKDCCCLVEREFQTPIK